MNGTTKTIIYIGNFELPNKNAAAQRVIANGKIFRDLGYKVVYIGISKEITHHHSTISAKKITLILMHGQYHIQKAATNGLNKLLTPSV